MAPNLNNNTFENLSLVLMFQGKAFFLSMQVRFSNLLLFNCDVIYAIGLFLDFTKNFTLHNTCTITKKAKTNIFLFHL